MKSLGMKDDVHNSLTNGSRETLYKERGGVRGKGRRRELDGCGWRAESLGSRKGRRREGEIAEHMIKQKYQNINNG